MGVKNIYLLGIKTNKHVTAHDIYVSYNVAKHYEGEKLDKILIPYLMVTGFQMWQGSAHSFQCCCQRQFSQFGESFYGLSILLL